MVLLLSHPFAVISFPSMNSMTYTCLPAQLVSAYVSISSLHSSFISYAVRIGYLNDEDVVLAPEIVRRMEV